MKPYIFDLLQTELMAVETEIAAAVQSQIDIVTDMGNHLLLAGGKRLRPALYFLCAWEKKNLTGIMPVAVAIELIHMSTLVHDDVLDNAALRRGIATANTRWGNSTAILGGDYLFAKAFSLISKLSNTQIHNILADVICEICEGEISQIREKFNPQLTERDYLKRIAQKTASFIAASCKLGAIMAESDAATVKALNQYGYAVGMAFQIMDDILDMTASTEQLGKPADNDLCQGILTLPTIYALQTSPHRDELQNLILAKDMSDAKLQQSMAIIHETDAIAYSYQKMREYLDLAQRSIPNSVAGDVRKALIEITDFVARREDKHQLNRSMWVSFSTMAKEGAVI